MSDEPMSTQLAATPDSVATQLQSAAPQQTEAEEDMGATQTQTQVALPQIMSDSEEEQEQEPVVAQEETGKGVKTEGGQPSDAPHEATSKSRNPAKSLPIVPTGISELRACRACSVVLTAQDFESVRPDVGAGPGLDGPFWTDGARPK